jgi:hypothetical protein
MKCTKHLKVRQIFYWDNFQEHAHDTVCVWCSPLSAIEYVRLGATLSRALCTTLDHDFLVPLNDVCANDHTANKGKEVEKAQELFHVKRQLNQVFDD